jgi:hypothetical protein
MFIYSSCRRLIVLKTTRLALTLVSLVAATTVYADCIPISSVPYTISQGGSYCLTADLSIDMSRGGTALRITASHVDVDFQGHTITNTSVIDEAAQVAIYGVLASSGDSTFTDITVRNGSMVNFANAISFFRSPQTLDNSNFTVDHMTVTSPTRYGITIDGSNVRVTNNVVTGTRSSASSAVGISVTGAAISGNTVSFSASNRAVIAGNTVSSTSASATNLSAGNTLPVYATGIYIKNFVDVLIRDNVVKNTWVKSTAPAKSASQGIWIEQMIGTCDPLQQACTSNRLGGLIVQDNTVANASIIARLSTPLTTGIEVDFAGDHSIVTGSTITSMNTGIAALAIWDSGSRVLALDNTFTSTTVPYAGNVVTLPQ